MGIWESHFRDGVGKWGESRRGQLAIGRRPRRAPVYQEGWAGLGWWSTDPMMQSRRRRATEGPLVRPTVGAMSSCNLIDLFPSQSPLSNLAWFAYSPFACLPISQSEIPGLSFLILLFLFPHPVRRSSKSQSPLSRVSVCACVCGRGQLKLISPSAKGERTSATCQPA